MFMKIANRAVYEFRCDPEKCLILCVVVDTPQWLQFAQIIEPEQNWQEGYDKGEKAILIGFVYNEQAERVKKYFCKCAPTMESFFKAKKPDKVKGVVAAFGGFLTFALSPDGDDTTTKVTN
jgi:hypothetical protein